LYEKFFTHYGNRDFAVNNKVTEKRILATLLFNMGTLYLLEREYDIGIDFFNEAVTSLQQTESSDEETSVSILEFS
jgi:hypothetical protein